MRCRKEGRRKEKSKGKNIRNEGEEGKKKKKSPRKSSKENDENDNFVTLIENDINQ